MRMVVLALAATALAQPALARDPSGHRRAAHDHSHHRLSDHVRHHHRFAYRHRRVAAARVAPDGAQPFQPFAPLFGGEPSLADRSGAGRVGRAAGADHGAFDGMVLRHAQANGIPESLVHRVIVRESRYNPRAVSRGNFGIMQIRLGTARAMGYSGSAAGLLDADTNMTYAVKYLAGAYRAAGGNPDRAVGYYARGYYGEAKAQGFSPYDDASRAGGFRRVDSTPAASSQFASFAVEPQHERAEAASAMPRRYRRHRI
jgi:soluble lytic murein transglycosylase-like protein